MTLFFLPESVGRLKTCRPENWLVHFLYIRELKRVFPQWLSGRLIDIGCGEKPLRRLTEAYVSEHVGVDHAETPHDKGGIDLFGTAYSIPVEDAVFDSALCTAVLEHLEEPEQALRECCRVLKPGGVAIYTVPFIWHLHEEPRDFYRFSKYGLEYLFRKAGFEVVEIKALSGFWATFGQLLVYNLYRLNRGPLRWFGVVAVCGFLLQWLAYIFDRLDRTEQWTWMYLAVVRKRGT